jgi:hypothetical protein
MIEKNMFTSSVHSYCVYIGPVQYHVECIVEVPMNTISVHNHLLPNPKSSTPADRKLSRIS